MQQRAHQRPQPAERGAEVGQPVLGQPHRPGEEDEPAQAAAEGGRAADRPGVPAQRRTSGVLIAAPPPVALSRSISKRCSIATSPSLGAGPVDDEARGPPAERDDLGRAVVQRRSRRTSARAAAGCRARSGPGRRSPAASGSSLPAQLAARGAEGHDAVLVVDRDPDLGVAHRAVDGDRGADRHRLVLADGVGARARGALDEDLVDRRALLHEPERGRCAWPPRPGEKFSSR